MDLNTAAAIATIIGTIVTVVATVLAMRGKLHLQLPTRLASVEARGLFVLGLFIVALPILAWGPKWGIMPSIANLMVIPGLPRYFDEVAPRDEAEWTVRTNVFLLVTVALAYMNLAALISLVPW